MHVNVRPPTYWVDRLENGHTFAVSGYSDAEWCCILGIRSGERTGLGQIIDPRHGALLADVLRRRCQLLDYHFAVPACVLTLGYPIFGNGCIDYWLGTQGIRMEAYERDSFTDDWARDAGLHPLIRQLRLMDVVLIGPQELGQMNKAVFDFRHVPIATPNLHREAGGIDDAVRRAARCAEGRRSRSKQVYLVSAGVSAAVIIDRLYDRVGPDAYYMDCGSIWDAFVGIGGQRAWRAELYADGERWKAWKRKCLTGV